MNRRNTLKHGTTLVVATARSTRACTSENYHGVMRGMKNVNWAVSKKVGGDRADRRKAGSKMRSAII